jgi:hypothetical protein
MAGIFFMKEGAFVFVAKQINNKSSPSLTTPFHKNLSTFFKPHQIILSFILRYLPYDPIISKKVLQSSPQKSQQK